MYQRLSHFQVCFQLLYFKVEKNLVSKKNFKLQSVLLFWSKPLFKISFHPVHFKLVNKAITLSYGSLKVVERNWSMFCSWAKLKACFSARGAHYIFQYSETATHEFNVNIIVACTIWYKTQAIAWPWWKMHCSKYYRLPNQNA